MRLLPHSQPAPPALPDPADAERERMLNEESELVVKHAKAIASKVIEGAKAKDKTCLEIYYKYLHKPVREEIVARKAEQPSAGPLPVSVRIAQARIQFNVLGSQSKPPVQLTAVELADLPEDKRTGLKDNYKVEVVEPALLAAPPTDGAAAVPLPVAVPDLNCKCQACGAEFHSQQPKRAKWCPTCRKKFDVERLALHKHRRGAKLSPKLRANLRTGSEVSNEA